MLLSWPAISLPVGKGFVGLRFRVLGGLRFIGFRASFFKITGMSPSGAVLKAGIILSGVYACVLHSISVRWFQPNAPVLWKPSPKPSFSDPPYN